MSENRLAWDQYFAAQALLIANRSTCKRAKVGAVLVKDNKVISTGYNGSVLGTEHCIDHEVLHTHMIVYEIMANSLLEKWYLAGLPIYPHRSSASSARSKSTV